MMKTKESKPGSNRYAIEAANYYELTANRRDTMELSYTDLKLAAAWARYHAGRWWRRAAYAAVIAIVAAFGIGLPDLNHDGRASLADLGVAARQAVGLAPAVAAPMRN